MNSDDGMERRGETLMSFGDILSGLVSRHGIGRKREEDDLTDVWKELLGKELAPYSCVGSVRRGTLEILVSDAILIQELLFQKEELLRKMKERFPEANFLDIRFRVGNVK